MTQGGKTGRLVAVVGASGVGKDTLIRAAMQHDPALHWARRAITRPASGSEPFEPLSEAEFDARLAADAFALQWHAHGLRYGISHAELAPLHHGQMVIFNGSRAALAEAWAQYPALHVIEITAPDALRTERLAARGRESTAQIAARITRRVAALPDGLPLHQVCNDGSQETGLRRFQAALQAVRA
ncbi:phosphonate metabolism protein/1,5-bisphosphokinase (PRPP-forming) PhnN [uncultured Thioclava sp.]|uniref:phosphonate metabolism protein/1,5-bisphosphokinase (PRPP-forming) PhnN n=1 Tax=uncultured Thioclava sp. TaxID=473858 RepID=UPI0025D86CDE|nr:phosphonate metabolism protein/1,5-bisphosphokinase (PRPP-forming) PhnN [uncultured Thioclava sp.]